MTGMPADLRAKALAAKGFMPEGEARHEQHQP